MLLSDTLVDVEEGWDAFTFAHGMDHDTVFTKMLTLNFIPAYYPLYDFPKEQNDDYLFLHNEVHKSNAIFLNISGVPDLSTVDFSDRNQVSDWMNEHQAVHIAENTALGLN